MTARDELRRIPHRVITVDGRTYRAWDANDVCRLAGYYSELSTQPRERPTLRRRTKTRRP